MPRYVKIVGNIESIETIAVGSKIRDVKRLRETYGLGRWRKLKGIADAELPSGRVCRVEVHWYEAHGLGRKELRIKRIIE
ncbi:hypothetical protein MYX82_13110 [Acidobacteria bacterium AH-259-D05]|nr:hypothetical protein [Acidobacteria bacterium AH-259-D05]